LILLKPRSLRRAEGRNSSAIWRKAWPSSGITSRGDRHYFHRSAMRRPVLGIDLTRFHPQGIEVFGLPPQLPGGNGLGQMLHLIELTTNLGLFGLQRFMVKQQMGALLAAEASVTVEGGEG
jgi:hypothetical protein